MNWQRQFEQAYPYEDFLQRYGTDVHRQRWQAVYDRIQLTDRQRTMLAGFPRAMHLLCVAGTWCGDCVRDGPILQRITESAPQVDMRFLDRDENSDMAKELSINDGLRIPMVLLLSEDYMECGRYGERTLATYRKMAAERLGPACPAGIVPPGEQYLSTVTQEWLNEVERVQLLLRLSPRLRAIHGD